MSYILDALKKAERERGIAKVPTLSSVHEFRTKPRVRLWAASGIALLCIAAFFGFFFFYLNAGNHITAPSLPEGAVKAAARSAPESSSPPADEMSIPPRLPVSSASPAPGNSGEIPARADEAEGENVDNPGYGRFTAGSRMVQSNRAAEVPRPGDHSPGNPPRELTGEQPLPPATEAPEVEEPKPAVGVPGEKRLSLREAMDGMTMSILFYSENKAERLVFINGRKYVEGDTIDGRYLLESITPEGAVLSCEGERALLRPERN